MKNDNEIKFTLAFVTSAFRSLLLQVTRLVDKLPAFPLVDTAPMAPPLTAQTAPHTALTLSTAIPLCRQVPITWPLTWAHMWRHIWCQERTTYQPAILVRALSSYYLLLLHVWKLVICTRISAELVICTCMYAQDHRDSPYPSASLVFIDTQTHCF